jgi:hypothetical protein
MLLFTACEEYYTPTIDQTDGHLVVDALITNDVGYKMVHLSWSRGFYSTLQTQSVSGAKVELIQSTGRVFSSVQTGIGYFTFEMVPEIGEAYKLRISIGKDIYESELVTMPPIPNIDSLYTADKVSVFYKPDIYGKPYAVSLSGLEFYINAAVTPQLGNYRFYTRSLLEWIYYPPGLAPPVYGWDSFDDKSRYNLVSSNKMNATINKIEQHPINFLAYNAQEYLHADTLKPSGWIITIDQFGTSTGSYDYHQQINSQFAADGSLFDPIQTQIQGNITCKTDPAKRTFGYFDLNSYRSINYVANFSGPQAGIKLRKLINFPYVQVKGQTVGIPPTWWQ